MKLIDISSDAFPDVFVKVSDADYGWLTAFKWRVHAGGRMKRMYAIRTKPGSGNIKILMHREIMGDEGPFIDHIDHDGLNNQRENLRVVTKSENLRNQRKQFRNTSSRFKGVYFCKQTGRWAAGIKAGARKLRLGRFPTELDAARAYDAAAKEHFGEHACLNFPEAA